MPESPGTLEKIALELSHALEPIAHRLAQQSEQDIY